MQRSFLALALCGVIACASAQTIPDPAADWKEVEAPPPPPLHTQGLVPIEVRRAGTLQFGVDPASVTVGTDRIVRYVVVATSATGTVNGIYEGIRCDTGEVKVYARHNPDSGWVPTRNAEWQNIFTTPNNSYSLAIARGGACMESAPNGSATQILQDLRAPVDRRFERGGANR